MDVLNTPWSTAAHSVVHACPYFLGMCTKTVQTVPMCTNYDAAACAFMAERDHTVEKIYV